MLVYQRVNLLARIGAFIHIHPHLADRCSADSCDSIFPIKIAMKEILAIGFSIKNSYSK